MSISLEKKEKISLKKIDPSLKNVRVNIHWNAPNIPQTAKYDVDISAFICENRKTKEGHIAPQVIDDVYTYFYGNLTTADGAIKSVSGDDLGGGGVGSEEFTLALDSVDPRAVEIPVIVTIDKADVRRQNFGMCKNGGIVVFDEDNGVELFRYDFSAGEYSDETAIHMASFYRTENGWEFQSIGDAGQKSFVAIATEDYGYPA